MPKDYLNPATMYTPVGTYTHVVTVSNATLIFIAGQVALDTEGNIVGEGDIGAQAEQVFKNLTAALQAVGATFDDVVKIVTYIPNLKASDRAALMEVYGRYRPKNPPTSTLLGVQSLARPEFLIEIEAIAAIDRQAK